MTSQEELVSSLDAALEEAIARGIRLLRAEKSERVEQQFYSGRS